MQSQIVGGFPDPPMIMRHVGMGQTKGPEGILHRVGETGHTAHMRAFAHTLGTDRVMRAGVTV